MGRATGKTMTASEIVNTRFLIGSLFLFGLANGKPGLYLAAWLLLVLGLLSVCALWIYAFLRLVEHNRRGRVIASEMCREADVSGPDFEERMSRVFLAFDVDQNQQLSLAECRSCIQKTFSLKFSETREIVEIFQKVFAPERMKPIPDMKRKSASAKRTRPPKEKYTASCRTRTRASLTGPPLG